MSKDKRTITDVSCPTCSSAAEVNSVIDNEDLQLTLIFDGAEALAQARSKCSDIEHRFPEAQTALVEQGANVDMNVTFSCGAEKVIFLMTDRSARR